MSRGWISFPADPQLQAEINMKGCMQLQAVLGGREQSQPHMIWAASVPVAVVQGQGRGNGHQAPDP